MRLLIVFTVLFAALMHGQATSAAEQSPPELSGGQSPVSRFYWVERAFCAMDTHGPDRAQGVIIWNHGISGTTEQWRQPVPPVFRLLQPRGWDVIALKWHNLAALRAAENRSLPDGGMGAGPPRE